MFIEDPSSIETSLQVSKIHWFPSGSTISRVFDFSYLSDQIELTFFESFKTLAVFFDSIYLSFQRHKRSFNSSRSDTPIDGLSLKS